MCLWLVSQPNYGAPRDLREPGAGQRLARATRLLVPLVAVGLVDDVGRDVADLLVGEAAAEGGHRVLAVRHLGDDGRLLAAAREVRVERLLAERLLRGDDVVAARVARGAVAREDGRAGLDVALWEVERSDGRSRAVGRRSESSEAPNRDRTKWVHERRLEPVAGPGAHAEGWEAGSPRRDAEGAHKTGPRRLDSIRCALSRPPSVGFDRGARGARLQP